MGVRKAIGRGEFPAEKRGKDWYCHPDALLFFGRNKPDIDDEEPPPKPKQPKVTSNLDYKRKTNGPTKVLSILEEYDPIELALASRMAQALQEVAKAQKLQRQNLQEEGRLMPREEFEKRLEDWVTVTRTRLELIPPTLAKELSGLDDPFEIEVILRAKIEDALHEIADKLEAIQMESILG